MKTKFCSLLAGLSMLAFAGGANAAQLLTDNQMDAVTAGFAGNSSAAAVAMGDFDASTNSQTATTIDAFAKSVLSTSAAQAAATSAAFAALSSSLSKSFASF